MRTPEDLEFGTDAIHRHDHTRLEGFQIHEFVSMRHPVWIQLFLQKDWSVRLNNTHDLR